MRNAVLHKIFYNEETHSKIESDFLPLDNRDGPEGWFELWPILKFLEENTLADDTWYGFFSPKFPDKVGLSMDTVYQVLAANPHAEVALFSPAWKDIVKFRNAWVQGERHHPGLLSCFEGFLRSQGEVSDLKRLVGDFETTVFSNYIIAKKSFWLQWRRLARSYFDYVTNGSDDLPDKTLTQYRRKTARLQAFVQERLACWLLANGRFRVVHVDYIRLALSHEIDRTQSAAPMPLVWRLAEVAKRLARKSNLSIFLVVTWSLLKLIGLNRRIEVYREKGKK